MELIICNSSFERIAQVNDASSKIWHRKYYEPGDFEIYVPANKENMELYHIGYYVVRDDDNSVGIIEDANISYDVNDEVDMLTVTGKFSESIYSRRIVWQQTTVDSTLENGLRNLIIDNIINPKSIDLSVVKGPSSAVATITSESTGIETANVNKNTFENFSTISLDIGESLGIASASVNKATFETMISKRGTYNFTYDGTNWTLDSLIVNLSSYGITYTDTPIAEDTIIITYSSNPTTGEYSFSYKNTSSSLKTKKSDNTGITRASATKEIFEKKITTTGTYKFVYYSNSSLISATKGESTGITGASVNKTTFERKITVTDDYDFSYSDNNWKLGSTNVTLSEYGISYTGTPQSGDKITIYYARATWRLNGNNVNVAEYGITYAGTPKAGDIIVIAYYSETTAWFLSGDTVNLSNYGISYTGTATNGDTIVIAYSEYTGISAVAIDKLKFQKRNPKNGTFTFICDGKDWSLDGVDINITSYGISYEDKPVNGNKVIVALSDMPNRKISNVNLGALKGYEEILSAQYTGDNLGQLISESCQASGIGYKNILNNGIFKFELYKGVDRSYNQQVNPHIIFSDEYDNLISSGYVKTTSNYKNTALVAGEGEGLLRTTKEINSNNSGLERRELYVDARNISSNNSEISSSDYDLLLNEKGAEELSSYLITEVFTGDVELTDRYLYKIEVDMGDICTIENKEWGVFSNSRIIGVIETDDSNGESIVFEFGS